MIEISCHQNGGNMSTPSIRAALERLLQHIEDPSYTAFAHGHTIAAVRACMANINALLTAISAAYSAHGWVTSEEFICLFEEVARLAGIVEDGWDASASPGDTKAKARAALAQSEGEGPTDDQLLRTYGLAKRSHCYDGPEYNWPKRAERAATVHGLRAVLARWGRPAPPQLEGKGPANEEALRRARSAIEAALPLSANYIDRGIRAVLAAYSPAPPAPVVVPVAVSERLPGPEDCDQDGFCWMGYGYRLPGENEKDSYAIWMLMPSEESSGEVWLPASAIPLPQAGEVQA